MEDYFWEDLLDYIEEGTVIPIVGPELVTVPEADGVVPLEQQVARHLADRLRLPVDALPDGCSLNDVVDLFLADRGRKDELYPRIRTLLKKAAFPPPPRLLDLARIKHFDLFVSITFDCCLPMPSTRFVSGVTPELRRSHIRPTMCRICGLRKKASIDQWFSTSWASSPRRPTTRSAMTTCWNLCMPCRRIPGSHICFSMS